MMISSNQQRQQHPRRVQWVRRLQIHQVCAAGCDVRLKTRTRILIWCIRRVRSTLFFFVSQREQIHHQETRQTRCRPTFRGVTHHLHRTVKNAGIAVTNASKNARSGKTRTRMGDHLARSVSIFLLAIASPCLVTFFRGQS